MPSFATTGGVKREAVHTIIVHTISGPDCKRGRVVYSGAPGDAARWKAFFDRHPMIGIHYVLDRDGVALASTPEDRQANHARNNNVGTIGIEMVHEGDGVEPFGDRQINALVKLIASIRTRWNVPIENIKGHTDVDSRTFMCGGEVIKGRLDPGANFPWERVRAALRTGDRKPQLIAGPRPAVRPAELPGFRGLGGPSRTDREAH